MTRIDTARPVPAPGVATSIPVSPPPRVKSAAQPEPGCRGSTLAQLRQHEPEYSSPELARPALEQQAGIAGALLGEMPPPPPPETDGPPPIPKAPPPPDWTTLRLGDSFPAHDDGPAWQVVEGEQGLRLTRPGPPAEDGGADWTETWSQGQQPRLERTVPAADGGPDWTETYGPFGGRSRQVEDPAGGPAWLESMNRQGQTMRQRTVPDPDGRGDWTETVDWGGRHRQTRFYTDENGTNWSESIAGTNRWRNNLDARDDARAAGESALEIAGPGGVPQRVTVYGARPEELEMLRRSLEALPPEMRQHAQVVSFGENIGEILNLDGTYRSGVAGFGGAQGILIDRTHLLGSLDHVLYHEMGHVQDFNSGNPSLRPPWGDGNAVSRYGNSNAMEDYAESHRVVLQNVERLRGMSREAILASYPQGSRYVEILDRYGIAYGTGTGGEALAGFGPPTPPPPPLPRTSLWGLDLEALRGRLEAAQ